MSIFPFPLLLCDIGGTNARFYWTDRSDAPAIMLKILQTRDYPNFPAAVRAALSDSGLQPASMIVCAAGPLLGSSLRLTNCDWEISGVQTASELELKQGLLLNDFEALAFSLANIRSSDAQIIGSRSVFSQGDGVRAILGPGTGLGIAALVTTAGKHMAFASEGGHANLSADDDEEYSLFSLIEAPFGRITAETILSGAGLARLHRARLQFLQGIDLPLLEPAEVTRRAIFEPSGAAADSIRHFWRITARVAGDIALTFCARQGVTLAGGILPKLREFLSDDEFRQIFESKIPLADFCQKVPTQLLRSETAAISAMSQIAARPDDFVVDYHTRCWK